MWLALAEEVWYSGEPTTLSLYSNVIFILCILTVLNAGLRRLRPAWAFQPAELLVIYVMLSVSTSLSGHDMLWVLLPAVIHVHRHGEVGGQFGDFIDLVPDWLVVRDEHALESAYIGQESIFDPANYLPWIQPLAWWFLFVVALCAVMWGIVLVFRKQWVEHEKLAYPIIQTPWMLSAEPGRLGRSRPFWAAVIGAGGINVINGIHTLYPMFPGIPIVQIVNLQTFFPSPPWNAMGEAWISFYPSLIGICFFMPLDLAFSSWFFFLMWKAQLVLAADWGIHGMPGFPFIQEQAAGGYYAIAFTALWISRRHIARVIRLAFGGADATSNPWERREARIALALMAFGMAILYGFCYRAGMSHHVIVMFFASYFLLSLAITRIRAELGPPSHDLYPVGAHRQVVSILGALEMGRRNRRDLVMFGFLNFFNRCMRTHPMPHGLEGFRLAYKANARAGRMLIAMWIAIIAGTGTAFFCLVWAYNKYGLDARMSVLPNVLGNETWTAVDTWIRAPQARNNGPLVAIIAGGLVTFGLAALRVSVPGWPLHPVGFAISASLTMGRIWWCLFIAWLAKALILRYGGARAYPRALEFFIGLVVGDFVVGSFWFTYGIIMEVPVYHYWPY